MPYIRTVRNLRKMSTPLGQFLAGIATDPKEYERFLRDPEAAMHAAGVSVADQVAIRSGDAASIQAHLTGPEGERQTATDSNVHDTTSWTISTPGEKP